MFTRGILLAFIVLVIDQVSKWYFYQLLAGQEAPIVVTPFFNLVTVWNYGVSFGMFNNLNYGRLLLSLVAIAITLVLVVWLKKAENRWLAYAIGLVIGGAIGNVIDRLRFGAVFDFLDFYLGTYHWPAFNVADSAICIGVGMLIIDNFRGTRQAIKAPLPKTTE